VLPQSSTDALYVFNLGGALKPEARPGLRGLFRRGSGGCGSAGEGRPWFKEPITARARAMNGMAVQHQS
jgi:hypothetical protein